MIVMSETKDKNRTEEDEILVEAIQYVAVFTITSQRCLDNLSGQTPECPDIHIFART